jgi:hypothetical protein
MTYRKIIKYFKRFDLICIYFDINIEITVNLKFQ